MRISTKPIFNMGRVFGSLFGKREKEKAQVLQAAAQQKVKAKERWAKRFRYGYGGRYYTPKLHIKVYYGIEYHNRKEKRAIKKSVVRIRKANPGITYAGIISQLIPQRKAS